MSLDPLTSIFNLGQTAIERIWPDANQRAVEMRKLEELKQGGDIAQLNAHVQVMLAQINVNTTEASHSSLMIAGWRPFIGWIGGLSMAYQFIVYPLLTWFWASLIARGLIDQGVNHPPMLDTGALFSIVTGMLGVGVMRSLDKKNNVDTKRIK